MTIYKNTKNGLLLLTLLLVPLFSLNSLALDKANVQVSAEGSIEVLPDYINISVQIEKTGQAKANVKTEVDQITRQVIDAALQQGIDKAHIDASQLAIYPQYEWEKSKRILTGETVRRSVNIKLYDLGKYTALANSVAQLDISQMQQQGYGFEDSSQHQNAALVKALANATAKAQLIADTIGQKLGKVYHVSESGGFVSPMPKMRMEMAMMADAAAPAAAPLEIRPQTVTANVTVIFLLK